MKQAWLRRCVFWLVGWLLLNAAFAQNETHPTISLISAQARALPSCTESTASANWEALDGIAGSARVVAFGEASHGVHEFLVLRNKIFKHLVEMHGFRRIVAETDPRAAALAEAYIQGEGDLTDLVVESVFLANRYSAWSFSPFQENRELLEWMRSHNANLPAAERIHFHGMNVKPDDRIFLDEHVLGLLMKIPSSDKVFIFAHNGHVRKDGSSIPGRPNGLGVPLHRILGKQYKAIGSVHAAGTQKDRCSRTVSLPPAKAGSINDVLSKFGIPCFFLDLDELDEGGREKDRLSRSWEIQDTYWNGQANYSQFVPRRDFDALIFVGNVTPVIPMRRQD